MKQETCSLKPTLTKLNHTQQETPFHFENYDIMQIIFYYNNVADYNFET